MATTVAASGTRSIGPVERGANDTRLLDFGVADLTSLMNVFARQSDVGGGWLIVLVWNIYRLADRGDLAPRLRRIILIGDTAVGEGFDLKLVGLVFARASAAVWPLSTFFPRRRLQQWALYPPFTSFTWFTPE